MSLYSIFVFLHVVGALGLFAGIGLEQVALANLRGCSTIAQAREWIALLGGLRRIDAPSGLLILATGFYMVAARWGHQAWIGLAILGMVVMAFLGVALTARRAAAIRKALPDVEGPIPAALRHHLNDRVLRTAASLRAALALGIVFNMSVRPVSVAALVVMVVALAIGAIIAAAPRPGGRQVTSSGQQSAEA